MSSPVGFVVLTYSDPPQIVRLVSRLELIDAALGLPPWSGVSAC